jgi:hypothetical protein
MAINNRNKPKMGFEIKVFRVFLFFTVVLLLFAQIMVNLQKARGTSPSAFWLLFSWVMVATEAYFLFLEFRTNRMALGKAFLKSLLIMGGISVLAVGIGQLSWLIAGGPRTEKSLAAMQRFCASPKDFSTTLEVCTDCQNTVVIYNTRTETLTDSASGYDFEVVRLPEQARYVACIQSSVELKDTCEYEKGREYELKYERAAVKVYSLPSAKQVGQTQTFTADAPNCPFFVHVENGVSDFPHFTGVEAGLLYQAIEDAMP